MTQCCGNCHWWRDPYEIHDYMPLSAGMAASVRYEVPGSGRKIGTCWRFPPCLQGDLDWHAAFHETAETMLCGEHKPFFTAPAYAKGAAE